MATCYLAQQSRLDLLAFDPGCRLDALLLLHDIDSAEALPDPTRHLARPVPARPDESFEAAKIRLERRLEAGEPADAVGTRPGAVPSGMLDHSVAVGAHRFGHRTLRDIAAGDRAGLGSTAAGTAEEGR